jgi:hypothetical protein
MPRMIALFVTLITTGATPAQQGPPSGPEARPDLASVAWLTGSWRGEGLGGSIEEHWTPSAGGTMMGAFRLVVEGEVQVIEYLMISQEENRVVMRFKHFRTDYTTWETDRPLALTLHSASAREAIFHSDWPDQHSPRRITYRRPEDDVLLVEVAGSNLAGELTDRFEIRFNRNSADLQLDEAR